MADCVAKVEKLGAAKTDASSGVRRKRRSQASPRSWGSRPWREQSVEWTPTDFFERHLHGPEKVAPTEPEDFCNNIGPNRPSPRNVRQLKKSCHPMRRLGLDRRSGVAISSTLPTLRYAPAIATCPRTAAVDLPRVGYLARRSSKLSLFSRTAARLRASND